jgi:hypothetical protein
MSDMGWNSNDMYNNPEIFGFQMVGTVLWPYDDYGFDITCVWFQPETREFWWANNSGCSCPAPFEDFTEDPRQNPQQAAWYGHGKLSDLVMDLCREETERPEMNSGNVRTINDRTSARTSAKNDITKVIDRAAILWMESFATAIAA